MSKINVSTITNRTGTSGPVLSGVTTATNGFNVTGGNVGIGTDNPNAALSVLSTTYPTVTITRDHPSNYPRLRITNSSSDGADLDGLGSGGGFRIACVAAGVSTERVRLTSTGCAIISSTGSFSPYVADANLQITDTTNPKLVINNPGNASYSLAVGTDNDLKFRNESTGLDSMLIDYTTNDLELVDGNLKVANGHGIDFSSTGGPSGTNNTGLSGGELFDDYETGYWVPTVSSGGNPGSVLSTSRGQYVKIGRQVTISFSGGFTGGDGGVFRLTNLPYNADSTTGQGTGQNSEASPGMDSAGTLMFSNWNTTAKPNASVYVYSDILYFYYTAASDGAEWTEFIGSEVGGNSGGGSFVFTLTYFAAP